ncbi:MAG: hypothetical protein P1S46_11100, partial [bacterium]|nr:hypothetical protein [bacterium]
MTTSQEISAADKDPIRPGAHRIILFGLAAYFLVSVLIRVIISSTADMDQTEQLVYTQTLRL